MYKLIQGVCLFECYDNPITSSSKNTDSLREKQRLKSLLMGNSSSLHVSDAYIQKEARPTHTLTQMY